MANKKEASLPKSARRAKSKPTGRKAKRPRFVYYFGDGRADGGGSMKPLLGGKGANLAEMTRIGLPVPPGFTITTEVCTYFYENKRTYPASLQMEIDKGVANMERIMGTRFGDTEKMPLLVAVRSGARDSMPGMMDTILNLGLNDLTVKALVRATKNERFAWDCYRRFMQMYGDVVMGVQKREGEDHDPFESVIEHYKDEKYGQHDIDDSKLDASDYQELVARFKKLVKKRTGRAFPNDPWDQLKGAAGAVFGSWMNDRAIVYRRKYNIPQDWGTAVNVQAMVYGNTGKNSGSGVAFTRNPANGADEFYGEFLIDAQGEDVVAGVRTPQPVLELKKLMPKCYAELLKVRATLERHFKDVQDIEFTIQDGKLFMLQTRNGKRTAMAALKFSMDMVKEKLIDWKTAVLRNPADQLDQLLAPIFDVAEIEKAKELAKGLPAGPGAASGKIYLNADRAVAAAEKDWTDEEDRLVLDDHGRRQKQPVLLVRNETSPEDLRGMIAAAGILTAKGGVSSHAALVARQMGKVCICGASALQIDYGKKIVVVDGQTFKEGDYLSIDGTSGAVYGGRLNTSPSKIVTGILSGDKAAQKTEQFKSFNQLMTWCSQAARLDVRCNADNPEETENALAFGAVGIGLTRTEHMFFKGDRIDTMRETIIFAGDYGEYRKQANALKADQSAELAGLKKKYEEAIAHFEGGLRRLLPMQRSDFTGIFKALKGYPATIRFLDPPLHEFLPHEAKAQADLARKLGVSATKIAHRVAQLHEFNPMLGHRGCRLGIAYPEITEMQARAVFEAAADVVKKKIKVKPEIMIPLVGFKKEFDLQAEIVHRVAKEVMAAKKVKFDYLVGTMIEVPRGALTADEVAKSAEFFSFGTNDLTQMALGISRDDMGNFLMPYVENDIFKKNPFATLDQTGVGQLMQIAVEKGRRSRANIKLGICGEHGGDPESVKFCHRLGLHYVSCSPFRVPIARLAAAQAALAEK